jgi:hypothetical protein
MLKAALSIFAVFFTVITFSQKKSDFYGEWKASKGTEKVWTLNKVKEDTVILYDWGVFFKFKEDGTYEEYASAPCGLDDNHYRYSGKWNYNSETKIIELTNIKVNNDRPNIYNNYKVLSCGSLKVLAQKNSKFEVEVEKSWEKITKKNNF